jgi:hypothetical protein
MLGWWRLVQLMLRMGEVLVVTLIFGVDAGGVVARLGKLRRGLIMGRLI